MQSTMQSYKRQLMGAGSKSTQRNVESHWKDLDEVVPVRGQHVFRKERAIVSRVLVFSQLVLPFCWDEVAHLDWSVLGASLEQRHSRTQHLPLILSCGVVGERGESVVTLDQSEGEEEALI